MKKTTKLEAILWSVAFPGFGQLLNGHLIKGIMFIFLEFTINVNRGVAEFFVSEQYASEKISFLRKTRKIKELIGMRVFLLGGRLSTFITEKLRRNEILCLIVQRRYHPL